MLKIGDVAPDFSLYDSKGKKHSLKDFLGQKILLYFYPKDDTPGCTKEACSFRDNLPNFSKLRSKVIGISVDKPESHAKFEKKYSLNFLILADPKKQVVAKYGVWQKKTFLGKKYMGTVRTSFLISQNGEIIKVYQGVKPQVHVQQVLEDLKNVGKN